MRRIAIFASGSGTNAENIARYFLESKSAKVEVVLSDNPTAQVFERMKSVDIQTIAFTAEELKGGKVLGILPCLIKSLSIGPRTGCRRR